MSWKLTRWSSCMMGKRILICHDSLDFHYLGQRSMNSICHLSPATVLLFVIQTWKLVYDRTLNISCCWRWHRGRSNCDCPCLNTDLSTTVPPMSLCLPTLQQNQRLTRNSDHQPCQKSSVAPCQADTRADQQQADSQIRFHERQISW